ncbi:MAG: DUF362 domain-containing protein [bacterium]|nr:DUF362 domain-containing protein [bacterium]
MGNNQGEKSNKVLVLNSDYSPARIQECIQKGLAEFGLKPAGRVFVKPNVVFAHHQNVYGSSSFTAPSVLEATIRILDAEKQVTKISIGEKSAVGLPTRLCYKFAGYYDLMKKLRGEGKAGKSNLYPFEEDLRTVKFVGGAAHSTVKLSRKMVERDFMIYLPKLKRHCVSNMTGAVKLNIGIVCDDDRSIRHDFLLDEKIVDLLSVGYPDFIVMDAVTMGAGNEAVPTPRQLGLLIIGVNPVAVDLVGCRIMGYHRDDIGYLKRAVERGYRPAALEEIEIAGDYHTIADLDKLGERLKPYDDDWYRWDNVPRELQRMGSPVKLFQGPVHPAREGKPQVDCPYGCVMGIKMVCASLERYAGSEAFRKAKPLNLIIGKPGEIDCQGHPVLFLGSCSQAKLKNPGKITRIDKCFTTATDMMLIFGFQSGIPTPYTDPKMLPEFIIYFLKTAMVKIFNGRYLQDVWFFIKFWLLKKL